jgi:predicted O-methyltransferase YrrM
MRRWIQKMNEFLGDNLGIKIIRSWRHSTKFAKNYFKDKKIIAIEVGSYKGINAKSILNNLHISKLYLVDPWEEYEDYLASEGDKNQKHLNKIFNECKNRLKQYKCVHYVKDYSDGALNKLPSADFIYIDGNHEYEYIKGDLENYYKKLNNGGIIAGHDVYWRKDIPVFSAVREFVEKNSLVLRVSGEDWWIIRGEKA